MIEEKKFSIASTMLPRNTAISFRRGNMSTSKITKNIELAIYVNVRRRLLYEIWLRHIHGIGSTKITHYIYYLFL